MASPHNQNGFTLLEVIVAITLAGILGAFLVQFMSSNLEQSVQNVADADGELQLKATMEAITRDYRDWLRLNPANPLTDFETRINTDPNYTPVLVGGQTGMISVDAPNDGDVAILQVTISDGTRVLRSLYTK